MTDVSLILVPSEGMNRTDKNRENVLGLGLCQDMLTSYKDMQN